MLQAPVQIPLQPVRKTMVRQLSPCSPRTSKVEQRSEQRSTCVVHGGPHAGQVTLWEAHAGGGSWQDLWCHGEPTLEQFVPDGLHHMETTSTGALHEKLQPMERTHFGEVCGRLPVSCWSR
ncbi:hypothetical protein DUI87_23165 [Hirundo rustica rustica]|uniref:Uncharacterized protein n=1 Tax=Hirundo rustica rustica TaxID=333673 RepID=A0A3M0JIC2_HIRRU|nr:hypothetical protein DUI87_23165 [Hirundo rustica rustica]